MEFLLPTAVTPVKNLVKLVSLQRTRVAPRPDFRAYPITVVQYLNEITCVADYQGNSPWTDYALRSSSTLSQHQAEAQHLAPLRPSGGGGDDGNSLIVIPGGVYAATGLIDTKGHCWGTSRQRYSALSEEAPRVWSVAGCHDPVLSPAYNQAIRR